MPIRKLVVAGLLIGLCVVGAQIKILGSIAFDSFPAFLGGLILGPAIGAVLGIAGHTISAALAGFPLSLPVHGVTALMMGASVWAYSKVIQNLMNRGTQRWAAYGIGSIAAYVLINIVALGVVYPWLGALVFAVFWPLTIANIANLVLAALVYEALPHDRKG